MRAECRDRSHQQLIASSVAVRAVTRRSWQCRAETDACLYPAWIGWLQAQVDGDVIRIEEERTPGADIARIRSAQRRALRDALAGQYAPGVAYSLDLEQCWSFLSVIVPAGGDYAGLGVGQGPEPHGSRTLRSLIEALLAHAMA
jgi:hypothetical protein